MDLGFGGSNQLVGDAATRTLMAATAAQEKAVEEEMQRFDAVLQDDDAIATLRARRLQEMKQAAADRRKWRAADHGSYTELAPSQQHGGDIAKAFFESTKQSERLIVHFYRPSTTICDIFHKHLAKLAANHLEARFVKLNVENCDSQDGAGASYLVEKLGIVIMPTIVIVKDRKVVHHIRGFDELGATEDFSTGTLARVLAKHGGIHSDEQYEDDDEEEEMRKRSGVNSIRISSFSKENKFR